jgi:RNA polymerase sigma factor (sigma-70 family)
MLPDHKIHKKGFEKQELELYLKESIGQLYRDMFIKLKRQPRRPVTLENLSDELLVKQYLDTSNKDLIAVLFERYTHLVYGICLNYLQDPDQSKDAVMDIFESLFHKLSVHKVENFRNWLYSVTRNHCLMALRKSGTIHRAKNKLREVVPESEPEYAEDDDEFLPDKMLIISAVEKLNEEQGTCIRLMYIDDKSYRDISAMTGYTMNEVKSHIQNGKRNLKNYLSNHNSHANQ